MLHFCFAFWLVKSEVSVNYINATYIFHKLGLFLDKSNLYSGATHNPQNTVSQCF